MFHKVNPKQNFVELEHKILDFWKENKIFEQLRKKIAGKPRWSFLDGPITANNPMGVHHAWGRTYKDIFQRYKAAKGYDQRFQNGFDCQGLWVEVEVEKELGFKSKKDIEKYGIDKFVQMCKEQVWKYSRIQTEQSIRLGQWMDWSNSYYTMSDENNYAIWHFLKKCAQDGNLYKGRDSVAWCPRCGTAISQHEILSEEYKLITHKAVYFKFQIPNSKYQIPNDQKNTYFLVWTTTPWTIPANVALALNPDFIYGVYSDGKENLILLKDLALKILTKDYILKQEFKGKELKGIIYEAPFDDLPRVQKAKNENPDTFHGVVLDKDLVTAVEGTGIVHIAPGAGAEDFQLSKRENLPVIAVIDEKAVYLQGMRKFSGKNAKEHPEIIFDYLKNYKNGKFFYKLEDYTHRYPTCWRCKEELVWRVVDEWYIRMDEIPNSKSQIPNKSKIQNLKYKTLREKMISVAKKIKWLPEFGLDQELDWLKNMHDWLISKKRYWGLSLPIFECKCGNFEVIGSKEELKERAVEGWNEFEGHSPHRPWVDKVKIECSKCGKKISRIPDVGNPWLDAGIVPYSTMGYFSDRKFWQAWFPADFICESFPGQFKNWFYSLIAMSAVLENTNPFKAVLGYATVRDEKGEEMHKSKGNAIWFEDASEKMGVDVMRWMYAQANPYKNLNFGFTVAEKIRRKIILLWNVYSFFVTYAMIDKYQPRETKNQKPKTKNLLDKWILSLLNQLIKTANERMEKYDVMSVMVEVDKFLDNLANWYVRRSRRRFWKSENDKDKKEAYDTLYEVLLKFCQILAPIVPFVSEEMYQNLAINQQSTINNQQSIFLCDYPKADKNLIDKKLNQEMELVRRIAALGLAARAKAKIKVRQPLQKLKIQNPKSKTIQTVISSEECSDESRDLIDLLKDEVNVKEIEFVDKIIFETETKKDKIIYKSKEPSFEVEGDRDLIVALEVKLTDKLKQEGLAREIIRHIQELRKTADYNVDDRIIMNYESRIKNYELERVFSNFGKYIMRETLAKKLKEGKEKVDAEKTVKIDEVEMWVGVRKS
ncbi:MAG: isoleucine--tRNA ligase [Patescibacteria group bacterium]